MAKQGHREGIVNSGHFAIGMFKKHFCNHSETCVSKINKVLPVPIALVLRVVFFCCDEESLKAFFLHTVFSSLGRNFCVQWRES